MSDFNEIKALVDTQGKLLDSTKEMKSWMEKANGELEASKRIEGETKAAIESLATKAAELTDKCLVLERKLSAGAEEGLGQKQETAGELLIKSDAFKEMQAGRSKYARIEMKAAIVNATGQNQPLVADMRVPGIIANPNRVLTIRDVLPVGRTGSNLVQFTRENVFTNSAGPQYDATSPASTENVTKPESGITFTLANAAVVTLAHFIPVSRQVLDDVSQF